MEFAKYLIDFLVYIALGAAVSWFFFYLKRLDLFGGFLGGALVALIGAILGAFLLGSTLNTVIDALQGGLGSNVNIIAALVGGVVSVMLLSKINNGRKRKEY